MEFLLCHNSNTLVLPLHWNSLKYPKFKYIRISVSEIPLCWNSEEILLHPNSSTSEILFCPNSNTWEFLLCENFHSIRVLIYWIFFILEILLHDNLYYFGIPLYQYFNMSEFPSKWIPTCHYFCYIRIPLCQNSITLEFHYVKIWICWNYNMSEFQ